MKCVNRNSRDFKLLAEHYNLSINALELLTHKYWLETGNEDSFPSDVYIRAYKGEIPFESHVKGHKKLWEMRYASPKIVDTKEELWAEVHKTRNFFPAKAITVYSTFDDKYAIKVKKPVENISAVNNLYRDNFTPQELKDYLRVSPGIPKDIIQKVPLSAITKEYLENIGEVVQMSVEPEKVDFTISANRPFSLDTSETRLVSTGGIRYNSVEQAFQHHKLLSVYDYLEEDKFEELSRTILAASPSKAREIGNKIPMSAAARQQWKDDSLEVLRTLMKESYVQNPKALEALLNTEDTILTVPANATGIDKEVPKILTDIRKELKSENLKSENLKPDTAPKITPQLVKHLKEYAKLLGVKIKGRAEMQKFLQEKGFTSIQQAIEENREMQEIKAKAIADGTFMKAPNGKPSNLTERQWLQVRTKNFINWFGDWINDPANASKVIDENGEPLVVYHGSEANINIFDKSKNTKGYWETSNGERIPYDTENAFFFTDNKASARSYPLMRYMTGSEISNTGIRHINELLNAKKASSKINESLLIDSKYFKIYDSALRDYSYKIKEFRNIEKELERKDNKSYKLAVYYDRSTNEYKIGLQYYTLEGYKYKEVPKEYLNAVISALHNVIDAELAYYNKDREDWNGNKIPKIDLNKDVYSIFLNIRNPFVFDYEGKPTGGKYKDKYPIQYINARQVKKALEDGYDGVIYQNIADPYLMDSYGAFNPNQIKSATDNNGMFSTENDDIQMFTTPQGEIYGFVAPNGDIYLDETVISPEHPIHEYTHLWDRIVAKKNPKLWKRGVELMRQTSLWKQIEDDPNYGQKWKDLKITGSKLESLIASEVHARFTGEGGENLLEQLAKEKGEEGIVDELKEWMQEFWQDLKATFSNWSEEDLKNLTLKDFNHMVVRDFADAVNFNEQPSLNIQDTAKPEKAEISAEQRIVQNFDNINTQFNNLLDSDLITSSEIRHVAEMVVNSISDMVTDIQEGKIDVAKEFPLFKTDFDFNGASRKDIFRVIGISQLLSKAKENFKPINAKYDGIDTTRKAFLILDNWDAFILRANDLFAQNEGFGIVKDYNLGDFSITQRLDGNFDNFNNYQDIEDVEEMLGDAQEHWQVEYRTVDILQALSENEKVKVALQKCYILDSEGNIVKNEEWGINERIPLRQSMNSIIQWTQGSLSLKDMIAKLEAKRAKNPWLSQVISKLTDTSGKEADFQSQFFGTFSRPFQLYGIVVKEDGKFKVLPVNKNLALTDIIQSIDSLSKTGNHALFGNNRININYLGTSNSKSSAFTLHTALKQLQSIKEETRDKKLLSDENLSKSVDIISGICKILEYPIDEEVITSVLDTDTLNSIVRNLEYMVSDLDNAYKKQQETLGSKSPYEYNPFDINQENSIGGSIRRFYEPMANEIQNKRPNAFYDSGKMYQSYTQPSFLTQLMTKFKTLKGQDFRDWIMKEYGSSQWFKTSGNTATSQIVVEQGWRNGLLKELVTNSKSREEFDHKVELNFNKHNYMKNMSDAEYTLSVIAEYWSNKSWNKSKTFTWFRVPMQSNKPSSDFLKLPSYREENTYKDTIMDQLYNFYSQEISRIQAVLMRNLTKDDPRFIENFDTNGKKFCFLPFLNAYTENSSISRLQRVLLRNNDGTVSEDNNKLASLLQKKIARKQMSSEEEATLIALVKKAIKQHMEDRTSSILENWEQTGIVDEVANIDGIPNEESEILKRLENFIWNDSLASKNILELTVGDISFYKDAEDLQKRLAQLHAPGIKPNIYATDYGTETREPARVSDGIYRTLVLSDFDSFKSNIIANISEVFDRKIARAPETQQKQLTALKDSLVGEEGVYRKINVTDAQAFNSPSSYRKKALMFGKWSEKAEKLYNNILDLNFKHTDFETAFQPLKPFVYTHLHKDLGVLNAPITNMPIPFQAKNAEYLLIMADAIIKKEVAESGELSRPNLLKAVYDVMEESEKINPTKGIDTVQFTSAIKSGLQAPIDLNAFIETQGGEKAAYNLLMNSIYKRNSDGTRSTLYNTDTFIHEAPYEDYKLQQEVPEHFKNHFQAHGSQERMIIPSDLDDYKNPKGDLSAEENQVFYTWKEADGTIKKLRANEFKKEYEETIAANIEAKLEEVSRIFHLDSPNKRERNIAISAELQKEILSSPRYGTDLIQACSVDMTTGEFRIPMGDPIQSKRIEQLLNSIIKNKVNKQEIAGGPLVQVTNWGTSKQLKIRFHTKDGGILMTEEEYRKSGNTESYKEYCQKNQAGIAYFEVFAPIWSDELFDKFADENGDIDIQAIEATDPELLKLITYRIPTEDKYSIAPCKIVGFMPKEAGDIMMLPYELTSIDDSDFDVDKRYVMRKELPIAKRPYAEIKEKLFNIANESYKRQHNGKENKKFINDEITQFLDNPQKMKNADKLTQWLYRQYRRIAYKTIAPTKEAEPKLYRDNKIIDMNWAVLTNEMTADKILNPGGFDLFKKLGYMMEAHRENSDMYSWESLQNMTTNKLKDISYTEKDLTFIDTQIQFYKQNAAAASLIGVFAVSKIAHAVLEGDDIWIDINKVCGNTPFTIAGKEFPRKMPLDPKYDDEGNLIGKTLGAGVSASADAAKSPVLNLMNINMATVNIFTSLLRLGMEPEKAALFMSQKAIASIVDEFNKRNLTDYVSLDTIIKEKIQAFAKEHKLKSYSNINTEDLTEEELIEGVTNAEHAVIDYKVLIAFQKMQKLADAIRKPSFATRFNSISSAVGPLIIDNLITENKIRQFKEEYMENGTPFYDSEGIRVDIDDIFYNHPILENFSKTLDLAERLFQDMPTNSNAFRALLNSLPKNLASNFYKDKKMLDDLSTFYTSYLLIQSGFIKPEELQRYVYNFPKYFKNQNFKQKYADNPFINAIDFTTNRSGNVALKINMTGLDESAKEVLRAGWTDLHKENPELSLQLFTYSFFIGGAKFSPKTFMALVPTYVKERLTKALSDGSTTSYVGTYRKLPEVSPSIVLDMFIRNNWENTKLVPVKKYQKDIFVDMEKGTLKITGKENLADLGGALYIKTQAGPDLYNLWRLKEQEDEEVLYEKISPLGNNHEYLEIYLNPDTKALKETSLAQENLEISELETTSPAEEQESEDTEISEEEQTDNVRTLTEAIMKQVPSFSENQAENKIEEMKENPKLYGGFLQNVFKQMGITLDKEKAIKKFKKMC